MTALSPLPAPAPAPAPPARVDIVVPVFDEQRALPASLRRLHSYLSREFPFTWRIVVVDNASTDDTLAVAHALAAELPGVEVMHLADQGRGRALRAAWTQSDAEVVGYMDVDLSTDLRALLPLVAPLLSGHSDLAVGTRLAPGARVQRGPKRELISRSYNALLHAVLGARFSDAQCGFKAVRADVARALVPAVRDEGWFFDTELLVLAQRRGLRLHEVAVDWVDDPDSRVDIVRTAAADLAGVARLAAARPVVRFLAIGVLSTLAFTLLYALLQTVMGAGLADALALTLCAAANTAANRRLTFGVRGAEDRGRHLALGTVTGVALLVATESALAALHLAVAHPGLGLELAVLVLVSGVTAVVRFAVLRLLLEPRKARRRALERTTAP